jgi:DNA-binding transcriptional ArsR family regulator
MDAKTRLLYWLLSATKGGPTRIKILMRLQKAPMNMRQLALDVSMDYKTVQGHVQLLLENNILDQQGKGYGRIYFISPEYERNEYLIEVLGGFEDGKKAK